jgi:hypothetical protein
VSCSGCRPERDSPATVEELAPPEGEKSSRPARQAMVGAGARAAEIVRCGAHGRTCRVSRVASRERSLALVVYSPSTETGVFIGRRITVGVSEGLSLLRGGGQRFKFYLSRFLIFIPYVLTLTPSEL